MDDEAEGETRQRGAERRGCRAWKVELAAQGRSGGRVEGEGAGGGRLGSLGGASSRTSSSIGHVKRKPAKHVCPAGRRSRQVEHARK